jgi:hypothetical protein
MAVSILGQHLGNQRRGKTGGAILSGKAQIDLPASPDEIGKPIHGELENGHGASFREITIAGVCDGEEIADAE